MLLVTTTETTQLHTTCIVLPAASTLLHWKGKDVPEHGECYVTIYN